MALLMVSPGAYTNPVAITNNIRYRTRKRKNESRRKDLSSYGIRGVSYNPVETIQQFKMVQRKYREPNYIGTRIFHEILHLRETDLALLNYDPKYIHNYGKEMCLLFTWISGRICCSLGSGKEISCGCQW